MKTHMANSRDAEGGRWQHEAACCWGCLKLPLGPLLLRLLQLYLMPSWAVSGGRTPFQSLQQTEKKKKEAEKEK